MKATFNFDSVKLDAVSQLRYNLSENNSMVVLTWNPEKRDRGRINYRVRIKTGSNEMVSSRID